MKSLEIVAHSDTENGDRRIVLKEEYVPCHLPLVFRYPIASSRISVSAISERAVAVIIRTVKKRAGFGSHSVKELVYKPLVSADHIAYFYLLKKIIIAHRKNLLFGFADKIIPHKKQNRNPFVSELRFLFAK